MPRKKKPELKVSRTVLKSIKLKRFKFASDYVRRRHEARLLAKQPLVPPEAEHE